MKVVFRNQELILPEIETRTITADTPQLAFVRSHKTDIQKEMGAICAILEGIAPIVIYDLMAGSGFSGKIFKMLYPESKLLLNDLDRDCAKALAANFLNELVTCENAAQDLEAKTDFPLPDLVFADFNNFTLRRYNDWEAVFEMVERYSPEHFLFTDSACFGFKFKKNLISYGVDSPKGYYEKLQEKLTEEGLGRHIARVCIFGNAALVLCSRGFSEDGFEFVKSNPVQYSIYETGGLL